MPESNRPPKHELPDEVRILAHRLRRRADSGKMVQLFPRTALFLARCLEELVARRRQKIPPEMTDDNLKFTVDVYGANGNYEELIARVSDREIAEATFQAGTRRFPQRLLFWRRGMQVMGKSRED